MTHDGQVIDFEVGYADHGLADGLGGVGVEQDAEGGVGAGGGGGLVIVGLQSLSDLGDGLQHE